MDEQVLEADYVIIGSGAVGMAFTDTMLTETDADFLLVDRRSRPGGHWNDAYPFVRLHQPSAFYGVNSRELGANSKDRTGLNKGLYELATGTEVCGYLDSVMRERFLPSGRVQYFPKHEYCTEGHITSLLSGKRRKVRARRKIVDATPLETAVPSTHPPKYTVAPGMKCVPVNAITRIDHAYSGYVVIGAGKTGMDACLWLLENGADPDSVQWIMPRDAWLLDRANVQPGEEFFERVIGGIAAQMEAATHATSVDDLFDRLEASGQLLRLDETRRPTIYRCATVTRAELEALRRIRNVVRLGYVRRIEKRKIVLDRGTIPTDPDRLHIDCSTKGLVQRPIVPVFDGDKITVQMVRTCQPTFSAAFIGHIEAAYDDDTQKNKLCSVVPVPDEALDWLKMQAVDIANRIQWAGNEEVTMWLAGARLDGFMTLVQSVEETDTERQALLQRLGGNIGPALVNLQKLLGQAA